MPRRYMLNALAATVGVGILASSLVGIWIWLCQVVWNSLVPTLFGGPTLDYWAVMGLLFLLSIVGSVFRKVA